MQSLKNIIKDRLLFPQLHHAILISRPNLTIFLIGIINPSLHPMAASQSWPKKTHLRFKRRLSRKLRQSSRSRQITCMRVTLWSCQVTNCDRARSQNLPISKLNLLILSPTRIIRSMNHQPSRLGRKRKRWTFRVLSPVSAGSRWSCLQTRRTIGRSRSLGTWRMDYWNCYLMTRHQTKSSFGRSKVPKPSLWSKSTSTNARVFKRTRVTSTMLIATIRSCLSCLATSKGTSTSRNLLSQWSICRHCKISLARTNMLNFWWTNNLCFNSS